MQSGGRPTALTESMVTRNDISNLTFYSILVELQFFSRIYEQFI